MVVVVVDVDGVDLDFFVGGFLWGFGGGWWLRDSSVELMEVREEVTEVPVVVAVEVAEVVVGTVVKGVNGEYAEAITGRASEGLGARIVGEVIEISSSESSNVDISAADRLRDGREVWLRAGYVRMFEEHL